MNIMRNIQHFKFLLTNHNRCSFCHKDTGNIFDNVNHLYAEHTGCNDRYIQRIVSKPKWFIYLYIIWCYITIPLAILIEPLMIPIFAVLWIICWIPWKVKELLQEYFEY